jgi:type I restriction enzyme S subunit
MADEWSEVSIAEIAVPDGVVGGPFGSDLVRADYRDSGVPVIRGANLGIGDKRFDSSDFVFVSEEKADQLSRNMAAPGDLIVTQRGTLGQVGIVPVESVYARYVISQSQMRLRCNTGIANPTYIYYWLLSDKTVEYIKANAVAAGVPHINLGFFKSMRLRLPPLDEQNSIAGILDSLDKKIDLNRRMNQTLEAMAQAVFRSWFVDIDPVRAKTEGRQPAGMDAETANLFPAISSKTELGAIPDGWTHQPVSSLVQGVFDGPHATPPEATEGPIYLGIKNLTGTSIDFAGIRHISESDWPKWSKRVEPRAGDIVFTYEATLGHFALLPPGLRCCLGRRTALVRPKPDERSRHYLFHWFISETFQQFLRSRVHPGATVDRILLTDFPSYPVLCPPPALVHRFDDFAAPIWARIHSNLAENRTLAALRDTLLPKLLSGEVRVKDAEARVGAAV